MAKNILRMPAPRLVTEPAAPPAGISAVERDTGLPKETLRAWERRYGFPSPERDAAGERLYPREQVDRLRLIRRLVDAGHRPGRIVRLSAPELAQMLDARTETRATPASGDASLDAFEATLRAHRADELRASLSGAAVRLGLERFVAEICAPLTRRIGEAWTRGELEIFEEHLFTEVLQSVLRSAISALPGSGARPRVLLTTLPCEPHGLGLLMAEAVMSLHGAHCLSLGTCTPVRDIALAARSGRSDVVALSFTGLAPVGIVTAGIAELRALLPPQVELWVGGSSAALRRRQVAGVRSLDGLPAIVAEFERWRSARSEP